jgi:glycosyltransferase involved in cell wall biosynthesis
MKVSVIMASWFNPQRKNMEQKFIRSVNSFLNQTYDDKELIIVGGIDILIFLFGFYIGLITRGKK